MALPAEGDEPLPEVPRLSPQSTCTSNELLGSRARRPLGIVQGITVRSGSAGVQIGAGLKSLVGGELHGMTEMCETAREQAFQRMLGQAADLGADGVIAMRYDTNTIMEGVTEVIAYGLAVSDRAAPSVPADTMEATEGGAVGSMSEAERVIRGRICTSNEVPNSVVHRSLGVVHGITVRSRNVFANFGASVKALVGGEISTYTKMCNDAREQAYERMVTEAVHRGADAIVGMRYGSNQISDGITEVLAFGTAVSSGAEEPADVTEGPRDTHRAPSMARGRTALLTNSLKVTTSNALPFLRMQYSLGVVKGITVCTNNMARGMGAGLRSLAGGEIETWTNLCRTTREQAFERMLEQAAERGAKGIVAMRYDSNEVTPGIVEVVAYGTAVTDEPPPPDAWDQGWYVKQQLVSTDIRIPGHQHMAESFGTVRGVSVQSCNMVRNIGAALKSIVGGEIRNYTDMCQKGREEAFSRMLQHAADVGGMGILGMRFCSNALQPGVIEVVAYGTAVGDGTRPKPPASFTSQSSPIDATLVSTSSDLFGHPLERSLGVVRGITVRSRHIGVSIGAGFQAAFVGGEVGAWTQLCETARQEAHDKMLKEAAEKGAHGVVALRYETNDLLPGVAEVLAYGTAVA